MIIVIVVSVGNGPKPGTRFCANKLHETWLKKGPDNLTNFCYPPRRKEIKDLFQLWRTKKPQFCIDCVDYAEEMLRTQVQVRRLFSVSSSIKIVIVSVDLNIDEK